MDVLLFYHGKSADSFSLSLNLNFIYIVADVDGDDVRCRWAESSQGECAGVCSAFTGATLTEVCMHFVTW